MRTAVKSCTLLDLDLAQGVASGGHGDAGTQTEPTLAGKGEAVRSLVKTGEDHPVSFAAYTRIAIYAVLKPQRSGSRRFQLSCRPTGEGRSARDAASASTVFEVPFKTPYMAVRFPLLRTLQGQERELPPPNSHPRWGCRGSYRPPDPRRAPQA